MNGETDMAKSTGESLEAQMLRQKQHIVSLEDTLARYKARERKMQEKILRLAPNMQAYESLSGLVQQYRGEVEALQKQFASHQHRPPVYGRTSGPVSPPEDRAIEPDIRADERRRVFDELIAMIEAEADDTVWLTDSETMVDRLAFLKEFAGE